MIARKDDDSIELILRDFFLFLYSLTQSCHDFACNHLKASVKLLKSHVIPALYIVIVVVPIFSRQTRLLNGYI